MSTTKFITDENNNLMVDKNGRPLSVELESSEIGIAENGIPTGGTAGQILKKVDDTDYNAEWADLDESGKLPEGGTAGQVLTKVDESNYNAEWKDIPESGVKKNEIIERAALSENPNDENADFVDNGEGVFAKAVVGQEIANITEILPPIPEEISALYLSSACVATGSDNNIYIFSYTQNIICFNPQIKEYTTLDVKLPITLHNSCAASYGDKIYLFGGSTTTSKSDAINSIYEFDIVNKTIEEIQTLPDYRMDMKAVAVSNNIYLIGGRNRQRLQNSIYKFDAIQKTVSRFAYSMPLYLQRVSAGYYNGKIYVLGGEGSGSSSTYYSQDTIIEIDLNTQRSTLLDETLPQKFDNCPYVKKDNKIYIFGVPSGGQRIIEFNPATITSNEFTATSSFSNGGGATLCGNSAYIFGGVSAYKWDVQDTTIFKYIPIPQKTSEIKNDSNFYAKPTDGIPETDLSQEVQDKLNESYTLPIASATVLGGVQPETKTAEMTQTVGVDEDGKLWTKKETVTSVNGKTGDVVIGLDDIDGLNEELELLATDEDLIAEKSARQGADTTLQSNIDAETAARESADTTLQGNIDAEATARENADTTLQNNITAEATARQSADNNLQTQITANTNALGTKADTTALTAETQARQSADNGLQQQVTAAQAKADTSVQYVAQTLNQSQREQALINLGIANRPDAQGILNTLNAYNNMYVGADSTAGARLYLQGQEFAATSPVYVNQDTAAWEAFATSFDWATYGSDVSGTYYFQPLAVLSSAGGGERGGITLTKNQSTGAISASFIGGGNITTFATYTTTGGWTISATSLSFSWAYIVSSVVAQDAWYQLFGQSVNFSAVKKPSGGGGTTVVANPAATGTVDLTKLQVGDTVYTIPSGGGGGGTGGGIKQTTIDASSRMTMEEFTSIVTSAVPSADFAKFISLSGIINFDISIPSLQNSKGFMCTGMVYGGGVMLFSLMPADYGGTYSGVCYLNVYGTSYVFLANTGEQERVTNITVSGYGIINAMP